MRRGSHCTAKELFEEEIRKKYGQLLSNHRTYGVLTVSCAKAVEAARPKAITGAMIDFMFFFCQGKVRDHERNKRRRNDTTWKRMGKSIPTLQPNTAKYHVMEIP
jgi:hypothetical protein